MEPVDKPIFGNKKMELEEELESFFCHSIHPHLLHCEKCQAVIKSILAIKKGKEKARRRERPRKS